ncbi:MAG TPA: fibronectin type III domain-containing protein, partial [Propionibacteriaceae bacterium]|nr:fibronectin type III domain-containing protein [Propionibacteriaceae bacterium]
DECYKSADLDPVKGATSTVLWRDPPVSQPEQSLVGVQYTAHLKDNGKGAKYIVKNSSNWVWNGTGFSDGSQVMGILGYETDRSMSEYERPANRSYTVLAESPVVDETGAKEVSSTSIYQAPGGAWVFGSGTNHWSLGLGKAGVSDSRIQQATANILDRFIKTVRPRRRPPLAPTDLTATAVTSTWVDLRWRDNSSNELGFTVERSIDGADWSGLPSAPQDSTTYRDTLLASETTYRYRVKATNGRRSSAYSNIVTVTTPPQETVVFAENFSRMKRTPWDARRWKVSTGTAASVDVQSGAGRMRFRNVPEARARAIAIMPKRADTDTVASFQFSSRAPRGYLYLFSRASGDWVSSTPNASYFVQITNDLTTVQLWKSQAGVTTSLGSLPAVAEETTAKQWLRFRVQGSSISVKVWTDGTAEPANWELTATDDSITAPGVLQLKWLRGGTATAGRDVILDDIKVSNRPG